MTTFRSPVILALVTLLACGPATKAPQTRVVSEDEARQRRLACEFRAGALPRETLPSAAPAGSDLPVDHVVLVMQENRSFDQYFSKLTHGGVRVAPADATNPDAEGRPVFRKHEEKSCAESTPHTWAASHTQWNNGANDGFVLTGGERAMAFYDETDIPFYYALSREFAISDMHFSSLLGPTWPNRMFYFAGTSWGLTWNGTLPPERDENGDPYPNLFRELSERGVSWRVYAEGKSTALMFLSTAGTYADRFVPLAQYFEDAAAGTLPSVSIVEPQYEGSVQERRDERAPGNIQLGQAYTESVVRALMHSPQWPRSAFFLTYDEHGGLYDSVPPPSACPPDDHLPRQQNGDATELRFDRYGFRVPLIVVSPFARRGYVSHHVSDLTSVLRFVQLRFELPALTARDANAEPLLDLFDFTQPRLDVPELPRAQIDEAKMQRCIAEIRL